MRSRSVYLFHVAFSMFFLLAAVPASALDIVINNGFAPPNPDNVIDDNGYILDNLVIRNVGCGTPDPTGPCPAPGASTEVALVPGGEVGDLLAFDSSTITMRGGSADFLETRDLSTATMSGGSGVALYTHGSSTATMSGGQVLDLRAYGSSTLTIAGHDFAVDWNPVPYGDLTALAGVLTGTLNSGESIESTFYQGGGYYTGTIRLVPEPSTVLLFGAGLIGLAISGRRRRA